MTILQAWLLTVAVALPGDVELIEFSASWCGPCQAMESVLDAAEAQGTAVTRVDVDQQAELARQYHVTKVPTLIFVRHGQVIDRVEGGMSEGALLAHLNELRQSTGGPPRSASVAAHATSRDPAARTRDIDFQRGNLAGSGRARNETRSRGSRELTDSSSLADERRTANPPADRAATSRAASSERTASSDWETRALAASVRLRIEDPDGHSFGSGTIIDVHGQDALILTCGHIFRDSRGQGTILIDVFAPDGERELRGELIRYDLDRDLALVGVRTQAKVQPMQVAPPSIRLSRGQPLFGVGCNRGQDPTILRGPLHAINQYLGAENLTVGGTPIDGRSGGGLFTQDGFLVGVCNAADPEREEGIYAAHESIRHELDVAKLSFVYQEPAMSRGESNEATDNRSQIATRDVEGRTPITRRPAIDQQAANSLDSPRSAREFTRELDAADAADAPLESAQDRTTAEQAEWALSAELAQMQHQGAEVICIVRPRQDPEAKSRVIVLDRPSRNFLSQLQEEQSSQDRRQMTDHRQSSISRLHRAIHRN